MFCHKYIFVDNGHNTAGNEPNATHYSNNILTSETNQPITDDEYLQQQQQGYDPNQEQYMQQQEYYDQTQYEGSNYEQNYDNQYDQYGGEVGDPNASYVEGGQYENYEERAQQNEEKQLEAVEQKEESEPQKLEEA